MSDGASFGDRLRAASDFAFLDGVAIAIDHDAEKLRAERDAWKEAARACADNREVHLRDNCLLIRRKLLADVLTSGWCDRCEARLRRMIDRILPDETSDPGIQYPVEETSACDTHLAIDTGRPPSAPVIAFFTGQHRFLSNFWPCEVTGPGGLIYPSVEHAYQAYKSTSPDDWAAIHMAISPGFARSMGRSIPRARFDPDWDDKCLSIMEELLRQKFSQPPLRDYLCATEPATLIEGNTWRDRFWGVYNGKGENHLGRLLMRIRADASRSINPTDWPGGVPSDPRPYLEGHPLSEDEVARGQAL